MAKTRAQRITSLNKIIDDALVALEEMDTATNAGALANSSGQGADIDHAEFELRQRNRIDWAERQLAVLGGVAEVTSEAIG